MKIAYLLAQFLYAKKKLDLPGIGSFTLDPSISIDTEHNKRAGLPDGISFQSNPTINNVPELVEFISSKSGKMKVLAESDLESHLQMIQQFLNINKPFSFEGIGTLVKIKAGEFEFTPGHVISGKAKDNPDKEKQNLIKKENVDAKYQAFLATPTVKSRWKKPVLTLAVICGVALAIWGGYQISAHRSETGGAAYADETTGTTIVPVSDTTQSKKDTVAVQQPATQSNYKFVLEVTKAKNAFRRYKQLQDTKLASLLQLETKDSVQYKLFVLLPITTDTTRVIDSLTTFLGKRVHIEHE